MGKDMKQTIKELSKEGWIESVGGKHKKLRHEKYGTIICSITPSCLFAHKKVRKMADRLRKKYDGK